ncbi:MFS transporter [Protaetiibacter intestinalis]|uniref:MFS transporter n=1 Tax=Protaetiibacter intestinalis TaxID=2419774 RepID=A0A387B9Y6_9MICO|nr:MFS transporter [Protaetiibacter intestinalis]AYF97965.1 MFS transporter [Protaetiibacter intestinalis]
MSSNPPDAQHPTEAIELPRRRRFVDLSPLREHPAFARLWIGSAVSGVGYWVTSVAVGLFIFDITGDTFAVALVGGISLAPMIVAGLWGGMLADAFDRRRVLIVSSIVAWVSILGIVALALVDGAVGGRPPIWPLYVLTTLNAVAATISNATRSSITPRIVPEEMVSRANALNGIAFGLQLTIGPALAGVLVAAIGFPLTFAVDAVLFTAGFLGVVGLPKLPPLSRTAKPGWESLRDGVRFLRTAPNIRMSFIVDIVAMSLGRPYVLLPAIGASVLGGGSVTVGVLTAATAVGTFLTSLFSGPVAHVHRYGVAIGRAIMLFGIFTALFGAVIALAATGWFGPVGAEWDRVNLPLLLLAAVFLAGTGASDEVSAIFRSTMLLTAAPDEMRGRLQGIFIVVVTGGPRVGDLIAGGLAVLTTVWLPPVAGGLAIVAIIAVLLRVQSTFRHYDARDPQP